MPISDNRALAAILTKVLCFFTALTLFLVVPVAQVCAENTSKPILTAEDAESFVSVLLTGDAASLDGAVPLTAQMSRAVESLGGFRGIAGSLSALGEAVSIGRAYEMTAGGRTVFRIPCRFQLMPLDLVLTTEGSAIAGLVTAEYTGRATEESNELTEPSYREISLPLPVPVLNGELPGTLLLPEGGGPFPAVVLVHGSGPNDRDETIMAQKPFRDLAEGLARRGIAVYRYDKRTFVYGAVMAGDHQLTLKDETIDDAAAALKLLRQQDGIDPGKVFILGHSLGATAIPAIDATLKLQNEQARGYILMAGSTRFLPELMKEQYEYLYSLLPEISGDQLAQKNALFSELDRLKDLSVLSDDTMIAGAYVPYWRWLAEYDVLAEAARITAPCLVLQGEEDYQVSMKDFALWEDAFKDCEQWRFISYPGLVHTFVTGSKSEGSGVYMRNECVDQRVIEDIAQFIQTH